MFKLFIDTETSGLPKFKETYNNRFYHYTDLTAYASSRLMSVGIIYNNQSSDNTDNSLHNTNEYYTTISDNILYLHTDAKAIHKLTIKEMIAGVKFKDFMKVFIPLLNNAKMIIGYNIDFDVNVLCSEMFRAGYIDEALKLYNLKSVCVMILYKRVKGEDRYRKLVDTYKALFGEEYGNLTNNVNSSSTNNVNSSSIDRLTKISTSQASQPDRPHNALSDIRACRRIYYELKRIYNNE